MSDRLSQCTVSDRLRQCTVSDRLSQCTMSDRLSQCIVSDRLRQLIGNLGSRARETAEAMLFTVYLFTLIE